MAFLSLLVYVLVIGLPIYYFIKRRKKKKIEKKQIKLDEAKVKEDNFKSFLSENKINEIIKGQNWLGQDINQNFNYLTGHPDLIKPMTVNFGLGKELLCFIECVNEDYKILGKIDLIDIEDVTLEDKSTIQRKTSGLDVLAYGAAGKMMATDKKVVEYYIIIKWKEGKFTNETIISFTSKNAVSEANELRSKIIKLANNLLD